MSFSRRSAFFASKASLALLGPLDAPPTARPKRSGRRKEPRAPLPSLENEPEAGGGEEKREKEGESKEERSRSEKWKKKLFIPLSSRDLAEALVGGRKHLGPGLRNAKKKTRELRVCDGEQEQKWEKEEEREKKKTQLDSTSLFSSFFFFFFFELSLSFCPLTLSLSLSLSLSRRGTPVELFSPYLLRPEKKPPLCSQGAGSQRGGSGTRRKKQVFWCFAFTVVHENDPFVFSFSLEAHTHTQNAVAPLSLPSLSYLFPPRA